MGKVVVLGSINQDVVVVTQNHPSPGETVVGSRPLYAPGGKGANEAVAAASAGARTVLIGAIGDDPAGHRLLSFMESKGVETEAVTCHANATTGTALITVDEYGENTIVVVPGANALVNDERSVEVVPGDVLLSQFEVPMSSIQHFFERGRNAGCVQVLNPSPARDIPHELLKFTDVLVVNDSELAALTKSKFDTHDRTALQDAASNLLPHGSVIVTLGAEGVVAVGKAGTLDLRSHAVSVVETTGAGDCFVGYLAAELSSGSSFEDAVRYSNLAAAICVTRAGAGPSMPTKAEVVAGLGPKRSSAN